MSHITLGALILAGGQNRRMGGSPKALLPNGSGALILDGLRAAFAGFDEKLLSTNTPELAAGTGFAPVPDARPGMGPLAGLAAALSACQSDRAGRLHPLCGVYTKQCLPAIQAALAAGEHRVGRLFQSVGGQAISLEGTSLPDAVVCNVNTPEELKELLQS